MPSAKITKSLVDSIEPAQTDTFVWDSDLRGFGLKVTPRGKKVYVANYRVEGSRNQKRATIGPHGSPWTPQTARRRAEEIIFGAAHGTDHNSEKRQQRNEAVDLAFDAYAEFFIQHYLHENWPGSFGSAVSVMRQHAIPYFRSTPITKITKRDAAAFLDTFGDKKATARKAAEVVGKMLRWAEDRGAIERSPMDRVPRPKASSGRERVLGEAELPRVWRAAEVMDHPYGGLVKMLILSGQRLGEVKGMRWDEIDYGRKIWEVPAGRTKSGKGNVVPLTAIMLDVIGKMPERGPLIFSITGEHVLGSPGKLKKRLDAIISESAEPLEPWTQHDLRRTVATGLQRLGVMPDLIEVLQGRTLKLGAGRRYQRYDYLPEKRAALEKWSSAVEHLIGRQATSL